MARNHHHHHRHHHSHNHHNHHKTMSSSTKRYRSTPSSSPRGGLNPSRSTAESTVGEELAEVLGVAFNCTDQPPQDLPLTLAKYQKPFVVFRKINDQLANLTCKSKPLIKALIDHINTLDSDEMYENLIHQINQLDSDEMYESLMKFVSETQDQFKEMTTEPAGPPTEIVFTKGVRSEGDPSQKKKQQQAQAQTVSLLYNQYQSVSLVNEMMGFCSNFVVEYVDDDDDDTIEMAIRHVGA